MVIYIGSHNSDSLLSCSMGCLGALERLTGLPCLSRISGIGPNIIETGQRANGSTLPAMQEPVRSLRFVQSEHIVANYYKENVCRSDENRIKH